MKYEPGSVAGVVSMACVADVKPSLPYKCDSCEFRARWPSEINQHRKNHSSVKPYACPRCTYRSKWKWDVVKHLKRCGAGVCVTSGVSVRDVIDHSLPPPPPISHASSLSGLSVSNTPAILNARNTPATINARKTPAIVSTARSCKKCGFTSSDLSELLLHQKSHLIDAVQIFSLPPISSPSVSSPPHPQISPNLTSTRPQSDPFNFSDDGSTIADNSTPTPATLSPAPFDVCNTVQSMPRVPWPMNLRRSYSDIVEHMRKKLKHSQNKRRRFLGNTTSGIIAKPSASPSECLDHCVAPGSATMLACGLKNPQRTQKRHKCRKCVYVTRSKKLLDNHVIKRHAVKTPATPCQVSRVNSGTLTCDMCAYEVNSASDLQTHIASFHSKTETSLST